MSTKPGADDLAQARAVLAPTQMALFTRLQPSEQAHALQVLRQLLAQGETHPDLLVAALLHDAGKARLRPRLWKRALAVLAKAIGPQRAALWGGADPAGGVSARGWRRPFAIAAHHPAWGAELAAQAGASPLAQALILRHQQTPSAAQDPLEDRLLRKLQAADKETI